MLNYRLEQPCRLYRTYYFGIFKLLCDFSFVLNLAGFFNVRQHAKVAFQPAAVSALLCVSNSLLCFFLASVIFSCFV